MLMHNLGVVAEDEGDYTSAHSCYEESLLLTRATGNTFNLVFVLESLASLAALQDQPERALRLLGVTAALRERLGMPAPPSWRPRVDRTLQRARQALGEQASRVTLAQGQALPLEQAIAEALDESGAPAS
jgi:hypothetical protein